MMRIEQQADLPVFFLPRGTALVVDQDRDDLFYYAGILRGMGFEVKAYTRCQEALRCLEQVSVDFVVVNQGSAAFEWQVVVQRAVARDRHLPVIVLTRKLDVGSYLEAVHLGATDYLEKPLTPEQVEHLVTTYSQPSLAKMGHTI